MENIKFYNDEASKRAYSLLHKELEGLCERLFPGMHLAGAGFSRNNDTTEVVIKLHLRPKAKMIGLEI